MRFPMSCFRMGQPRICSSFPVPRGWRVAGGGIQWLSCQVSSDISSSRAIRRYSCYSCGIGLFVVARDRHSATGDPIRYFR